MIKKRTYVKPNITFEEIETVPLCDISVGGSDMGWGDGSDTERPGEQSVLPNFDGEDQQSDFVFNLEE